MYYFDDKLGFAQTAPYVTTWYNRVHSLFSTFPILPASTGSSSNLFNTGNLIGLDIIPLSSKDPKKNNPASWPKGFKKWYTRSMPDLVIHQWEKLFGSLPGMLFFMESHWAPITIEVKKHGQGNKEEYSTNIGAFGKSQILEDVLYFKSIEEMVESRDKKKKKPYVRVPKFCWQINATKLDQCCVIVACQYLTHRVALGNLTQVVATELGPVLHNYFKNS